MVLTTTLPLRGSASPSATSISRICRNLYSPLLVSWIYAGKAAVSFQTQDQVYRASELPSRALLGAGLNGRSEKPEKPASCPIIESPLWGSRGLGTNMGKSSQLRSGNQGQGSRSTTKCCLHLVHSRRIWQTLPVCYGKLYRLFRFRFFLLPQSWSYRAAHDVGVQGWLLKMLWLPVSSAFFSFKWNSFSAKEIMPQQRNFLPPEVKVFFSKF